MTGIVALPRKIAATVSADGALVKGKHNPVDATAAARTMTLPTGAAEGVTISVVKTDATANLVSITGNIGGVAASTVTLGTKDESQTFTADSAGSWWMTAGNRTKGGLDRFYGKRAYAAIGAQPVGSLAFSTTGLTGVTTFRPFSVGLDGAVYGRFGGGLFAARLNTAGTGLNGSVDFSGKAQHSGGGLVRWATQTEAGYVVVTQIAAGVNTTYVWFSTTWAIGGFSLVATIPFLVNDPLGIPNPQRTNAGKTVLFCGAWDSGVAVKPFYASFDGGATWTNIKNTWASPPDSSGTVNSHWHTALYHPRWDRVWVSGGDGVNAYFGFSNDHGATWHDTAIPSDSPVNDGKTYLQPTAMVPFQDRIATGPDRGSYNPGIWDMDPITGLTVPKFVIDSTVSSADKQYPVYPFAQSGHEAYVAFPASISMPIGTRNHTDIAATGDGGRNWYKVATIAWSAADLSTNGICGPDTNGYLYHVGSAGLQRAPVLDWIAA